MLITTVSFPCTAFSTGRDRHGEPLLYNDEIKASFDELISTLEPGDTIAITKWYKDRPNQEAHLIINNDRSVIKSGDLPMFYTTHESPQIEGWRLAADLGQLRSRTKLVIITTYQHEEDNNVRS